MTVCYTKFSKVYILIGDDVWTLARRAKKMYRTFIQNVVKLTSASYGYGYKKISGFLDMYSTDGCILWNLISLKWAHQTVAVYLEDFMKEIFEKPICKHQVYQAYDEFCICQRVFNILVSKDVTIMWCLDAAGFPLNHSLIKVYLIGDVLCNLEERQKGIMLEFISILRNSEIAYSMFNKLLSLFDDSIFESSDEEFDDAVFGSSDEEEDI